MPAVIPITVGTSIGLAWPHRFATLKELNLVEPFSGASRADPVPQDSGPHENNKTGNK
jgi:hypothetical protein